MPRRQQPEKPTVFLSHSSSNRRQMLGLKRLLDSRAGGLIDFFMSSDDDSIAHGTIWPAEVRAALDRMSLMLIFVSSEALKSGWTYFEAGYGLHKLGAAKIYCLPGTDKAALPSPFNILQNRNLHSARDVSLLVSQINAALGARINDAVTKEEYDRIFRRPAVGFVQSGPSFDELVESITVKALGPHDSIEAFSRVCRSLGAPVSNIGARSAEGKDERYSTGVRLAVDLPEMEELESEFEISLTMRRDGFAAVEEWGDHWREPLPWQSGERRSIREIEAHNAVVRRENAKVRRENAERAAEPRECVFVLSPINFAVSVEIVDQWLREVGVQRELIAEVRLHEGVTCESKAEAVSAKIHGSELSLRDDGALLWSDTMTVGLPRHNGRELTVTTLRPDTVLNGFKLPELVTALFELNILARPVQKRRRR